VDIDSTAIAQASRRLPTDARLLCADSLDVFSVNSLPCYHGEGIDLASVAGVISNPPWGAELCQSPAELRAAGYQLAQGQFDSYDLFVEMCLKAVPVDAILAFIIPDSVFFPEHKPLRTLLLERTQLHLVARLGEGFFHDVYRGTAVVVCQKRKPQLSRNVQCFRLHKDLRDQVLDNQVPLRVAKDREVHLVPQKCFSEDSEKRFIIDVSRDDLTFFAKIDAHRSNWTEWLVSGRGVELSKTGTVVFCPTCSTARPEPRDKDSIACEACGTRYTPGKADRKRIIRRSRTAPRGWKNLIVGEDVDRYTCRSSRIIEADVPGINYKTPETFQGTKLLVRKTGIGLKAAIDDTGAFTNQVVFHYRCRSNNTPSFFLDYVLGVLCSRVMLAYHLKRTGENEWRSHPYVTQKTIAELPVPVVSEGTWGWKQARAIADAAARRRSQMTTSTAEDLHIDSLVAGIYGLSQQGCDWVLGVLNEAQSLEAITTLRAAGTELKPFRI
jgi:hypothetical protein